MFLDLSGLKCPLPVLKTRNLLATLTVGQTVTVVTTDPLAGLDIPNLVRETGNILHSQERDGETLKFVIKKAQPPNDAVR